MNEVKVFSESNPLELQNKINSHLKNIHGGKIRIEYSVAALTNGSGAQFVYSALVHLSNN